MSDLYLLEHVVGVECGYAGVKGEIWRYSGSVGERKPHILECCL